MNKSQALYSFWSSFGWDAYDESSVPDFADENVEKYISYTDVESSLGEVCYLTADLWARSKSWDEISQKAHQISDYLGFGGVKIPIDHGFLWIKRGNPFSTRIADEDFIRRIHLNIEVDYIAK